MWDAIVELAQSKKAIIAVCSLILYVAGRYGIQLSQADTLAAVTPLWLFIVGQGIADHGKAAAQVAAGADDDSSVRLAETLLPLFERFTKAHTDQSASGGGAGGAAAGSSDDAPKEASAS